MFIFLLPDFQKQEIPHLLFRDIIDRMEFRVDTASIILLMEGVSSFATERLDMYCPILIFVNKYVNEYVNEYVNKP